MYYINPYQTLIALIRVGLTRLAIIISYYPLSSTASIITLVSQMATSNSSASDIKSLTSTRTPDKDQDRQTVSSFLRRQECHSYYWPVPVSSTTNRQVKQYSMASDQVMWWFYWKFVDTSLVVHLVLAKGAQSVVVSYDVSVTDKHIKVEDLESPDIYTYASVSDTVHAKYREAVSSRLKLAHYGRMTEQQDVALSVRIEILKVTPLISAPDCTLDVDIQSAIADDEWQDVTLLVGPDDSREEIKANKFMLVARSPVFARMFDNEMKERETSTVVIPDISPDAFKVMLSFVYTGKLASINRHLAEKVLAAADKYQLVRLKAMCENLLNLVLNVKNAAHILSLANMYNGLELKQAAIKFVADNNETCSKVMESEGWKEVEEQGSALVTEVLAHRVKANCESPSAKRPRLA